MIWNFSGGNSAYLDFLQSQISQKTFQKRLKCQTKKKLKLKLLQGSKWAE